MDNKLILILVDGMRPDALAACGNSCLLYTSDAADE